MKNTTPSPVSPFFQKIYKVVARISRGKVATYGQIARLAKKPSAARAVGMAMSRNTDTKAVPCHRVVASSGALTGYAFGGVSAKKAILLKEGVKFRVHGRNSASQSAKVDFTLSLWKE